MGDPCIFCRISAKHVSAVIVAENDSVVVIKDIHPKAPVHWLIIPKKHIVDLRQVSGQDQSVLADILFMARDLSEKIAAPGDFKLVFNNGSEAGQRVFHMHAHFLAGGQTLDI